MAPRDAIVIGTAGWNVPRAFAARIPAEGTHLQRYARMFRGAEINSSFYRPHARATYARWAEATPADFRFAVKLPRAMTHEARLVSVAPALTQFLDETSGLGNKRGPILVQLPPSLEFEVEVVRRFFGEVRDQFDGPVVCEPRHVSWTLPSAEALLRQYHVARVAADPPRAPAFATAGGWEGMTYFRLHGAPRTYWSRYSAEDIANLATSLGVAVSPAWCIFDNTASGAAIENAFELQQRMHGP